MTECKYCDCALPVGRHVALDSFRTVRMESTKQLDDQFVSGCYIIRNNQWLFPIWKQPLIELVQKMQQFPKWK